MNIENIRKLIGLLKLNKKLNEKLFVFDMEILASNEDIRGSWDKADWCDLPIDGNKTIPEFCKTACCIAGTASLFLSKEVPIGMDELQPLNTLEGLIDYVDHAARAQRYLDISNEQANILFYPWEYPSKKGSTGGGPEDYTIDRAINVLERLYRTGIVDWANT